MISEYSLKPRAFLIEQHNTVTNEMMKHLLSEGLVPVLDLYPGESLSSRPIHAILSSLSSLPADTFEKYVDIIETLLGLRGSDWVVIERPDRQLFAAKIKGYKYKPHRHLHVKHFIEIEQEGITLLYDEVPGGVLNDIANYEHLQELPSQVYALLNSRLTDSNVSTEHNEEVLVESVMQDVESSGVTAKEDAGEQVVVAVPSVPRTVRSAQSIPGRLDAMDEIAFEPLHTSLIAMSTYLQQHTKSISDYVTDDADHAFEAEWESGAQVRVLAFNLTDERDHSVWLIDVKEL